MGLACQLTRNLLQHISFGTIVKTESAASSFSFGSGSADQAGLGADSVAVAVQTWVGGANQEAESAGAEQPGRSADHHAASVQTSRRLISRSPSPLVGTDSECEQDDHPLRHVSNFPMALDTARWPPTPLM